MPLDPASFWKVPAFLEYVQPPLTPRVVAAAEAQLGVRLPEAYLALLRHQNGGYLRGSRGVARTLYGIGPGYPSITLDRAWWRPRNADPAQWAPARAVMLVPFDGDGHWDMCFDYRAVGPRGEPAVTLVESESEREEPVAADFAGYLAQLVDDTGAHSVRIHGDATPEAVARALAARFGAPAPTTDSFSYGYPVWRVALPGTHEWCWCTPNRVPAGFRRDGQKVITTPETALRLPADPTCAVLVDATEASRETVRAAVATLALDVR